jgi:hypothetical protein
MDRDFEKIGKKLYKYKGEQKTLKEWILAINPFANYRRTYARLSEEIVTHFEDAFKSERMRLYARDFVGKEINNIKILECVGINKNDIVVKCKCHCGNIFEVDWSPICRNKTKSCGCLNHRLGNKNPKFDGCGEISKSFLFSIQRGAEERNLLFNITCDYIWSLFLEQERKCAISKLDLRFPERRTDIKATASLDRIDPTKGYIEGNVQWVHKDINTMKWDFTQEEFINYCKIIAQNN